MSRMEQPSNDYKFFLISQKAAYKKIEKREAHNFKKIGLIKALEGKSRKQFRIFQHCEFAIHVLNDYLENPTAALFIQKIKAIFLTAENVCNDLRYIADIMRDAKNTLKKEIPLIEKNKAIRQAILDLEKNRTIACSKMRILALSLSALTRENATKEELCLMQTQESKGMHNYQESISLISRLCIFTTKSETSLLIAEVLKFLPSESEAMPSSYPDTDQSNSDNDSGTPFLMMKGSDRSTTPM